MQLLILRITFTEQKGNFFIGQKDDGDIVYRKCWVKWFKCKGPNFGQVKIFQIGVDYISNSYALKRFN